MGSNLAEANRVAIGDLGVMCSLRDSMFVGSNLAGANRVAIGDLGVMCSLRDSRFASSNLAGANRDFQEVEVFTNE